MPKRKKAESVPVSGEGKGPVNITIPPEVAQCFNRTSGTVDISTAHNFLKKRWEAVRLRVEGEVEELGESQYRLTPRLLDKFVSELEQMPAMSHGDSSNAEFRPGDWVAHSLFMAAWNLDRFDPAAFGPTDIVVWDEKRPRIEAWKGLQEFPDPSGAFTLLEVPGHGQKLRPPASPEPVLHPRIRLDLRIDKSSYQQRDKKLPTLIIKIEGEPVCTLINTMPCFRVGPGPGSLPEEAEKIWEAVFDTLYVWAGLKRIESGRPQEEHGYDAAHLHDFEGLSWTKVAARLCQESAEHRKNPKHRSDCTDKFRKSANAYYKKVRKAALSVPIPQN